MAVLHTYSSGESGLCVNSYIWETASSVAVIDANLLNADVAAVKAKVAALGKPLAGVFVTHAHPDHFNGAHALVEGTHTPIYATSGVAAAIRETAEAKREQWAPVFGDQWPAETAYPTVELKDGESVRFDDLSLVVRDVGKAESHADSYYVAEVDGSRPVAFVGDLAFNGTHPYIADGHTAEWLAALDALEKELHGVATIYPGHGGPAGPEVLAEQRRYLLHLRELVRRLSAGTPQLEAAAAAELERALTRFLPDAPLAWMIKLGADAVAAELNGEGDG